jgi:hypothetical protein
MSAQQIKKLEALLARVQERAAEPRVSRVSSEAAPAVAAAPVAAPPVVVAAAPVAAPAVAAAPALIAVPPPRSSAPIVNEPEPSVIIEDDDAPPTPAGEDLVAAHAQPKTPEAPEVEITEDDGDAEVSTEMVEVDVDEDDLMEDSAGAQSHTQMVAAAPADDNDDDGGTLIQAGVRAPTVAPEGEITEEAPASSRRPAKAADPFVDEARPPQTPPPESGRQVASVHPAVAPAVRESRVPTPPPPLASFEAEEDQDEPPSHGTMVGGWREPGMPPDSVLRTDVPPAAPAVPVAAARPASIKPETTQAAVAATGAVAVSTGQAPAFVPSSFGDLLDASLGL